MPSLTGALHFSLFFIFLTLTDFVNAEPIKWLSPKVLRQIKSINEDLIKPPNDKREYRHVRLKNDMRILLISDKESTMAGASLTVNVGSNSDPREYQGLAHFLEHMLLLYGSKKYPEEGSLNKFISAYNGYINAGTSADWTVYFFTIMSRQLFSALDMFVDHLVAPLLTPHAMQREIEAVDSEFSSAVKNDHFRLHLLMKFLSHKNHDFNKFSIGNRYSLKDDTNKSVSLHQALVRFYNHYYSSNLMALVLIGNFSLDQLTEKAVPLFSHITNKRVRRPTGSNYPYDSSNLGHQVNVISMQNMQDIEIWFPVPDDIYQYSKNLVLSYTAKLLARRGHGSLLQKLKTRHLAVSLRIIFQIYYHGYFGVSIKIHATNEGFMRIDEIISIVFNYISWIKKHQPQEWIFRDLETIKRTDFKFKDQMSLKDTLRISWHLQDREPRESVFALPAYRPDLILKLFQYMDVSNFNLFLIAKNFSNMTFEKEKWTETEYKLEKITQERLKRFLQPISDMKLSFSKPNKFLPTNLSLVSPDDSNENGTASRFPQIVHESNISRAWHKQDLSFRSPKAKYFINFYSPVVRQSPIMIALLHIYEYYVSETVMDHLYPITEAGVQLSIKRFKFEYGLTCEFEGYSDKMDVIIQTFMTILLIQEITSTDFIEAKQKVIRDLKNSNKAELFDISINHFFTIMFSYKWPDSILLKEISGTTFEDLLDFRQNFFTKIYVELFAYGNVNKEFTKNIHSIVMETISAYFPTKPFFASEFREDRLVRLPEGSNVLFRVFTNTHNVSCTLVTFQADLANDRSIARAILLAQLIKDSCFSQLRTKEQLGYTVYCFAVTKFSANTFQFFVQGHHDPSYVDSRIEALLITLEKYLHNLNETTIEDFKSSLISSYLKPQETLFATADEHWKHINSRMHHFELNKDLAENTKNITKVELLNYFKTYFNVKSAARKKLSIHVKSTLNAKPMKDPAKNLTSPAKHMKVKMIEHWDQLKNHLPFYPLLKSYMNLPPLGMDVRKVHS